MVKYWPLGKLWIIKFMRKILLVIRRGARLSAQLNSNNKLGTYLMVLNENTNEIQLIDSKYNINPSLFRATKMTCIDDINADNSNELVTIINNNVIVCYQIPSLN